MTRNNGIGFANPLFLLKNAQRTVIDHVVTVALPILLLNALS
jgi:hypothetical protein